MRAMGVFVGVDVSKATLDVFVNGESFRVSNDDAGIQTLIARLSKKKVRLVVFESTGQYHRGLRRALLDNQVPAHLANPQRVRAFSDAKGHRAKTDPLDAKLLSEYAAFVDEPNKESPELDVLQTLVSRRQQIQKMIVAERLRRMQAEHVVRDTIQAVVDTLKKQLKLLDERIHAEMAATANRRLEVLSSVPGIGHTTAAAIICWLPELGHADSKQLAALVGVAPFARDSGDWRGQRSVRGGRRRVRTALYMAALVAVRFNPTLRAFYARLLRTGMAKKAAVLAATRKLLDILNAMLRHDEVWRAPKAAA